MRWAEQLFSKKRQKRDYIYNDRIEEKLVRTKREDLQVPMRTYQPFNDELWSQEWYLVGDNFFETFRNTRQCLTNSASNLCVQF